MTSTAKIHTAPAWEALFPGLVHFDEPGSSHTSIGVGGNIDLLLCPTSISQLGEMLRLLNQEQIPYAIVGNWTNLIITEKGYHGCLICTKGLNRLRMLPGEVGTKEVIAEAGVSLAELVSLTVRENLGGFAFGAGIPGSIGGAVRMNAGAYGHSISELIQTVILMERTGRLDTKEKGDLHFTYRDFDLPEGAVIVKAAFLFCEDPEKQVEAKVKEILEERRRKHPLQYKNAGSIFKNPPECPAGRLIDEAGMKGVSIGDAVVSEKHGNFIVNRGHATADDIFSLIRHVQERIARTKGIALELEVKILGDT